MFLSQNQQKQNQQADEQDAEDGQSRDGRHAGIHLFSCTNTETQLASSASCCLVYHEVSGAVRTTAPPTGGGDGDVCRLARRAVAEAGDCTVVAGRRRQT